MGAAPPAPRSPAEGRVDLDLTRAGLAPCPPNHLRRTSASRLRAAGAPTDLIAPVMGHADTRMVERVYGRRAPSDERARGRR